MKMKLEHHICKWWLVFSFRINYNEIMKKLLLFVFSLFISIEALAKLPPYIDKNTFTNICKNVSCSKDFNSKYISTYFHKGFHKALALSTSKSGNRYSIDYFSWSWQYPSSIEAYKHYILLYMSDDESYYAIQTDPKSVKSK